MSLHVEYMGDKLKKELAEFMTKGIMALLLVYLVATVTGCGLIQERETKNPVVTLEIEGRGAIRIELYPKFAPNTVNNFIALVQEGFYDGLIFHRVIPDFMIQGGCPEGTGRGNPDYSIEGEFDSNDFDNPLLHTRGVISMARSRMPNSAGSQFFIVVADEYPSLDGNYAAFGKVIEGMDIVDDIVSVRRDDNDKPYTDQVIEQATVELFGERYRKPRKIR